MFRFFYKLSTNNSMPKMGEPVRKINIFILFGDCNNFIKHVDRTNDRRKKNRALETILRKHRLYCFVCHHQGQTPRVNALLIRHVF